MQMEKNESKADPEKVYSVLTLLIVVDLLVCLQMLQCRAALGFLSTCCHVPVSAPRFIVTRL